MQQRDKIIGECLRAAAEGPFFPDWEFSILFGLQRSVVARIAADWPHVDLAERIVGVAVWNSILYLVCYPIKRSSLEEWSHYLSISREDLFEMFKEWRWPDGGIPLEPE